MEPAPPPPPPAALPPVPSAPDERAVALWVLELGGEWLLTGKTYAERHIVKTRDALPPEVTSLIGVKLPRKDPRVDAALAYLASVDVCRALSHVDLAGTPVSEAGLEALRTLLWLERIDLSDTPVTLQGVTRLAGLPELREVDLQGTPLAGLSFTDLFGQRALAPAIRRPLDALQRGLARLVDLTLVKQGLVFAFGATSAAGVPLWRPLAERAGGVDALGALTWRGAWLCTAQHTVATVCLLALGEALLRALAGSTPGKALLRLRVIRGDGRRPGARAAARRALSVAARGFLCGLWPLSWLAALLGFARLWRGRQAAWDRAAGTRVVVRPCGLLRTLLALAAVLVPALALR
jgi:hypothetical protein